MMNDTLKVGVIGLGEIGQAHCDTVAQVKRARLIAVADIDQTRLADTASRTKAQPYHDYRDLLANKDLDAVISTINDIQLIRVTKCRTTGRSELSRPGSTVSPPSRINNLSGSFSSSPRLEEHSPKDKRCKP